CGFGVYMIHYFFTGPAVLLVRAMGIPVSLQILVAGVIAFTVSWAIVAGVYKLLGAKTKYIMG
ncbi:MAG: acyltransferase, partial [Tannerellaceae bacterium]